MNFLAEGFNEILSLANSIITRQYQEDDWLSILDSLARIFNADGAFIGFWKDGFIELKYSSSLIKSYQTSESLKITKVNLKDREVFRETLIHQGYIKINDYDKCEYALDEWKRVGLHSLLAVVIKTKNKIYGSLHVVKLKKSNGFNDEHIEPLRIMANAIASELEKDILSKKLEEERDINAQYIKVINNIALDNEIPRELDDWVLGVLSKIKDLASANMVSFIMPSENIYVKINNVFSKMSYDEFRENPLYNLWESNIIDTVEFTKDKDLKGCGINSPERAIVIPITSDYGTIAILCLGFSNIENHIKQQSLLVVKTILKYFTSLIYTYKNISRISSKLSDTETGLIKAFISSMEAKDVYTKGHSEHVAIYAKNIGTALGLNENEQESLYHAGLLHDIGKIGIPDNILLKPGKLTPNEYEIVKLHPIFSYEIIKSIPKFKRIADCIRHHHERIDGSGYPDGLKNDKIELGAKVLAIADIFDALTTQRPYRNKMSPQEALNVLKREPVDLNILEKIGGVLKESYISENTIKHTFVPPKLEEVRKDMTKRDYTTGLYRREALVKTIEKYIESGETFILFMVDVKNISYINYKYGVDVGDKIIVFVAEELSKISSIDALSRTGADVFMFIYKGTSPGVFMDIVSKELKHGIIRKVKQKSCMIDKKEADKIIGCYITYTEYPKEAGSAEECIYKCLLKKKELCKHKQ